MHGFTLGGAQFASFADTASLRVLAPDLPGHGATTVTPVSIAATVAALADWIETLGDPLPVIGYSQGGRIALLLALERPDLVERLVLISASPGIRDRADRRARAAADAELAASIRADGLAAFLDRWLAGPLVADPSGSPPSRAADRRLREANTAEGLAAALDGLGQGAQPWVGDRIGDLRQPLLAVSGERDPRAVRIGADMAEAALDGEVAVVPGAGHNVVRDAPGRLAEALQGFI